MKRDYDLEKDFNTIDKYATLMETSKILKIPYEKVEKVIDFFDQYMYDYISSDPKKPISIPFIGSMQKITKEKAEEIKQTRIKNAKIGRKFLESLPKLEELFYRDIQERSEFE